MAKGGEVVFDFKGNDKDLQKTTKSATGTLKGMASTVSKTMLAMTATVATAFAGIVTASVKARGEIEQSIGGVQTIFKDSANELIKNAQNAYKTAGISANKYMEQATSFGASLLQSLNGDTKKATESANRAIIDMSDNANKMGTSMEMIQNAYQGFAKQNYTMLDNLKLGYGGTKTEMERLVSDASKMTDIQEDLNVSVDAGSMSFGNIVNAISVMQKHLGIAGTTGKEATETLTGSINMLKASWQNFLAGVGGLDKVVQSASIAFQNIMRIVSEAVPYIITELSNSLPQLLELGGKILNEIFNGIMNNLPQIVNSALQITQTLLNGIITNLPKILQAGIQMIQQLIIGIAKMLPELIPQAVDCIITLVEGLLDNIDMLVDAGIELILGLADGLIEALPRLIEKAPEIIEKLFNALVRNAPRIIKAGGILIGKLIVGIIASVVKLVEVAPRLVSALVNGIKNWASEVRKAGIYMVQGIWNGITEKASWLYNKVKNFARNILDNMKSALGIHSPSTLFADIIGKNSALGIGVGFENEMGNVSKMMNASMIELGDMFELSPSLNSTSSSTSNVNVTIHNNMETDFMGNLVNNIKTYSNGSKNDYNYGMAY